MILHFSKRQQPYQLEHFSLDQLELLLQLAQLSQFSQSFLIYDVSYQHFHPQIHFRLSYLTHDGAFCDDGGAFCGDGDDAFSLISFGLRKLQLLVKQQLQQLAGQVLLEQ